MFDAVKYWQEKKERQRLRTRGVVMAAAALMSMWFPSRGPAFPPEKPKQGHKRPISERRISGTGGHDMNNPFRGIYYAALFSLPIWAGMLVAVIVIRRWWK